MMKKMMKMSENSRTHYHGAPNKDECMDFAGGLFAILLLIVVIALLVLM